jgi:hypothetical protein
VTGHVTGGGGGHTLNPSRVEGGPKQNHKMVGPFLSLLLNAADLLLCFSPLKRILAYIDIGTFLKSFWLDQISFPTHDEPFSDPISKINKNKHKKCTPFIFK